MGEIHDVVPPDVAALAAVRGTGRRRKYPHRPAAVPRTATPNGAQTASSRPTEHDIRGREVGRVVIVRK